MLAYSGGLDTSVALRWLAEEYGAEVVALLVDVGQGVDREAVTGARWPPAPPTSSSPTPATEFAREFVLPVLQAGALYEGRYPLVSALSRPLIARHLVAVAREAGATAVAHGCTGKGNDQVRFETAVAALAPDLAVLAPVRDWGMTREQEIAYAERHGIEVPVKRGAAYSIDQNLWGRSIEAGPLEDPWVAPPEEAYALTLSPERAFHAPQEVEITVRGGRARGRRRRGAGPGRADRPGRRARRCARRRPDRHDREPARRDQVARGVRDARRGAPPRRLRRRRGARLRPRPGPHEGRARGALRDARLQRSLVLAASRRARRVHGADIRRRDGDGAGEALPRLVPIVGRRADVALYDHGLATYEQGDSFQHGAAAGFIHIWSLPSKTWAAAERSRETAPA